MTENKEEKDEAEKELYTFLEKEIKIDSGEAAKIASHLRRTLKLIEKNDIAFVEPKDWKSMLGLIEIASVPKRKLLLTINKMRKEIDEEALNIKDLMNIEPLRSTSMSNVTSKQEHTEASSNVSIGYHCEADEENDPTELQIECEKNKAVSCQDIQETTSNDIIRVVPQDYDKETKRLRIYLCCSTYTKPGHSRIRSVSFLTTPKGNPSFFKKIKIKNKISINHNNKKSRQKVYVETIATDPNLSFDLFDQNNKIANKAVLPSYRVILVEEGHCPSASAKATAKILGHL
ncbi:hypothetical protein RFI_30575, partial [Reticulomyxa filosa]